MEHQAASPVAAVNAGLARRIGSLCYEIVLLVALLLIGGWLPLALSMMLDPAFTRPLFQLILLAISATYFVYCWTHGGQTLPMRTWRIRLTMEDGSSVGLRTALHRYLFALTGIGLCGLSLVWALFDRDRQFLHDRLAGTRIVRI